LDGETTTSPGLRLIPGAVRRKRLELALTQRELAEASGLDPSAISYLERGSRRARLSSIKRLAAALGCEPLDIAQIEDD